MSNRCLRRASSAAFDNLAGGSMGDVISELYKEGHIRAAHYVAVCRLLDDMRRCHGTSAGIITQYGDRVQSSTRAKSRPPGGGDPDAFARMDNALCFLREHERQLLAFLIKRREMVRGSLADLGRVLSAYKTNKTTRALAVGKVSSLAATIAEAYGLAA